MRWWVLLLIILLVAGGGTGVFFAITREPVEETLVVATPQPGLPSAPGADLSRRSELSADDDQDGLSNGDELAWGTDPLKADTDGDGYLDGEEVRANHDPRIPAPNDKLEAGEQPQTPEQRLATLLRAPTIDPYLRDTVSYEIGPGNLTEAYEKAVPAAARSEAALTDFSLTQPIETALPRPESLPAPARTTPAMLSQYLFVVEDYDVLADKAQYNSAQTDLYLRADTGGFEIMHARFVNYGSRLQQVPVPETAIPLHTLLLAYTQAQVETLAQISAPLDPVKAKVAERQAVALDRAYFPLIRKEFNRLRSLEEAL